MYTEHQKILATLNALRLSDVKIKAAFKGFPFVMENPVVPWDSCLLGSIPPM